MDSRSVLGTEEWADENENLINGCSHDCKYCYAKAIAIQYKRVLRQDNAVNVLFLNLFSQVSDYPKYEQIRTKDQGIRN